MTNVHFVFFFINFHEQLDINNLEVQFKDILA